LLPDTQHLSHIPINSNLENLDPVILEAIRLIFLDLSNNMDMFKHYPIEIKIFREHPVECPEDILVNDFGENLSKLDR